MYCDVWGSTLRYLLCLSPSLLAQSRARRAQASEELREREELEKDLSVIKAWIQETRELLHNPTPDIDALLQNLEVSGPWSSLNAFGLSRKGVMNGVKL